MSDNDDERRLVERKAAEDFDLPSVQAYYGHSLESGPGNCHAAATLVMAGLAMESPQLDWCILTGLQDLADGRGLHSWLEAEGLVVDVAARTSGATEVQVYRNRDAYYEQYRVDAFLTVTMAQWRKWWSVEAGTRWPPRDQDLDRLNKLRRKPVSGRYRGAILSARRAMGWDARAVPPARLPGAPIDSSHDKGETDTTVFEDASGALGFKCLPNRCQGHDWRSCRERLEAMAG